MRLRRCKLVLASASPRRRELLAQMGYRFEAVAPDVDEAVDPSLPAERQAEVLAERKAEAVAGRVGKALVLGADTLVACEGRVIGKAADAAQAREFLRLLTSHRHAVITGLCALDTATGERQVAHDTTWVTMQPMSEAELDGYIAGCGWRDKAGAYAIQEGGDRFIERLDGSESNVVGLPVELVARLVPHSFSEHLGKLHRDVLARHRGLLLTEDDLARVGPCVRSEEATIPPLPRGEGRGEGAWGAAGAGESTLTRPPLAGDLSPRERRAAPDGRPDSQAGLLERSFGRPGAPLEVEIGPGKDDFVVREAKARPETNFLAVERLRERVDALCGKIRRARVSNVRVFYGEAGAALSRLVRPGSVRAFYVHFPDPWPKRRHGKHRLIQPAFAAQVAERLIPGGRLTVITDDRPYAEQVLECLDATPGLANIAGKGHWATELPGYHQSVYEKKRRAAGCVIYYMRFAKA